jgi:predicted transcriptional regulator
MGVIQVQLPDELKSLIDRQIAEGRVASEAEFFVEAARRFVADLTAEDEIVAEAEAGIANAEAGRFVTITSRQDIDARTCHTRSLSEGR